MTGALRRLGAAVLTSVILALTPTAAHAAPGAQPSEGGLSFVHREQVTTGPYALTAAFTEWPMKAERSLDIVFLPDLGTDQITGRLTITAPSGTVTERPLLRHPRMRTAYGLDIYAFREQGTHTLQFTLAGPRGPATGSLDVPVGARPGPPVAVGWLPTLAIMVLIAGFTVAWWRRYQPWSVPQARTWAAP